MTNQFPDDRKKVELQAFLKLVEEIENGNKEFIEEQNEWLSKIGQMERNLELLKDLKHFLDISSSRELNSFEKGIKEEIERMLDVR